MRDQIQRFFQNPVALAVAVGVGVLLLLLIIVLVLRSRARRRKHEARVRSELQSMQRETQFAAAAEQTQYLKEPEGVTRAIASLFRQHLSMPALAIYAGREEWDRITNVLRHEDGSDADPQELRLAQSMPDSLSSSQVGEYWRPQVIRLSSLTGETGATMPQAEGSEDAPETRSLEPAPGDETVAVLPWKGAFNWNGIIVARAAGQVDPDMLARFRDPLTRLGNRLAVALEHEREETEVAMMREQVSRNTGFARSLIRALDEPSALASIAREVAALLEADSAALWRVEEGKPMLRMVAAYGLRSAEFLPLPLGQGLAGVVVQSRETLALSDAPADPRCIFPREALESGIVSYLGAPIIADEVVIGVVEVHTARPQEWSESARRFLESAATVIGEVVRSTDVRGNRLKVESAYLGLSEALQRLRSREEVLEAAVEILGHALGVSRALIVDVDERGEPGPVRHEYKVESVKSALGSTYPAGAKERLAAATEPVQIADSRAESLMAPEAVTSLQVLSELAIPLRYEGQTRAIIHLHQCDRMRQWQRDEVDFADRVGRQLSLSLANLTALDAATRGAEGASSQVGELERRVDDLKRALDEARRAEERARQERDRIQEDEQRVRFSSQQLLEINRLKSEFIVNAGHELEASLQSVLGFAEQLQQGGYGHLTGEQLQAVRALYGWARRMKNDIDWLIEYGSTRSRRLEPGGAQNKQG